MNPEDRLAVFLSEDDDASTSTGADTLFVAEVMQTVARRELAVALISTATTALAAGAVLWACAPVLDLAVQALAPTLLPVAGILTLVAAASILGGRLLARR